MNRKTVLDGRVFDSKREANRYAELILMQRAGEISELTLQPRYPIEIGGVPVRYDSGRQLVYVADFEYLDNRTNEVVLEDAKGVKTQAYRIKRALMKAMGKAIVEV